MRKRDIDAARQRLNFARERLAEMSSEGRATLTTERLVGSYGVTAEEAAQLVNQFGWRG